ncbi:MAG: YqeG family HAD IIIA-type phosphatase [Pseudanabaenaceae cyanobacterium bins.68]|nr:YqeG family HAD IIIA-type phosphatase [Pseudanabaenaceae cyanobacterium bins.68]
MSALSLITPDLVLPGGVWLLTEALLQQHQLEGLILDVDNTIVGEDDLEPSAQIRQWLETMRQSYPIWLISNNFSDRRIQTIAQNFDLPYRSRAGKPSRRAVRQALEMMNLPVAQVAMVGDRLFTDTLVGNRLGLFTVLVEPPQGLSRKSRSVLVRSCEIWLARQTGVKI